MDGVRGIGGEFLGGMAAGRHAMDGGELAVAGRGDVERVPHIDMPLTPHRVWKAINQ